MGKIGNKDLAGILSAKYGLDRTSAEGFVSMMFEIIMNGLKYDKQVKVKGLGTFKMTSVASRKSVDVNTGEAIIIEGRDKINFVADASMRDRVNRPFAQFETVVVNDGVDFEEIDLRFAASLAENEEQTCPESDEEDIGAESHCGNTESDDVTEDMAVLPRDAHKESVGIISFEAEDNAAPLQTVGSHFAVSDQVRSEPGRVSEEVAATLVDVPATDHGQNTMEEVAAGSDVPSDRVTPKVFSLSMEQLAVLNGHGNTQGKARESRKPQDKQHEEYMGADVALPQQEQAEEQRHINRHTEQLFKMTERHHRYINILIGVVALLVVICVCEWLYMGSLLEKRSNRIQHLEVELMAMLHAGKTGASTRPTADSAAVMKAKEDSVLHAMQMAEIEKARMDSALKAEEAAHKQRVADRQREIEESRRRATERMKAESEKKEKTSVSSEKKMQTSPQSIYDKDVRIRTGAYKIVGIDRTVTVRSGQTLAGISRANLGAGMECYVEAVNGGRKEFKAGEKVNIPKLQLKKK